MCPLRRFKWFNLNITTKQLYLNPRTVYKRQMDSKTLKMYGALVRPQISVIPMYHNYTVQPK